MGIVMKILENKFDLKQVRFSRIALKLTHFPQSVLKNQV